ncbi:uncharacterized protein LOC110984220 isoform X2 [Acanthaster planci]|uniref:Uncharacterized protein LOC110984220 isoform X2 n=1 Tax=Acanthaster planci TaxID=133434 RepID=A0A8B7Z2L8_ACAPL|nr:uncharacterized protein LOC110984220 isoform X2 [Acanthaster planci]
MVLIMGLLIRSVLKYIHKEKQKIKDAGVTLPQTQSQMVKDKVHTSKERKLSKPSLKVEDASGHYRPSTKEMTSWPRVTFDGHAGSCPFDEVVHKDKTNKGTMNAHGPGTQARADQTRREKGRVGTPRFDIRKHIQPVHTPGRQQDVGVKDNRKGYCECCRTKYLDLEKHLAGEQHRSFVHENNHYVNLDTMIDEGPNIEQFLNDVIQHHEWQRIEGIRSMEINDEVRLISSPSDADKTEQCLAQVSRLSEQTGRTHDTLLLTSVAKPSSSGNTQGKPVRVTMSTAHLELTLSRDQPASCMVSPQKRLQAHVAVSGTAEIDDTCRDRITPIPATTLLNRHSSQDNQQSDTGYDMANSDQRLRKKLHAGSSKDCQNSPLTRSSRQRGQSQMTSSSPHGRNPQVTSPKQCKVSQLSCQSVDETLDRGEPGLSTSPEPARAARRQSSRLSLSARRRQSQRRVTTPAEERPAERESPVVPVKHSRVAGSVEELQNTPKGAGKKERSLRLSLTARKRLLKRKALEHLPEAPDKPSKSCEQTAISIKHSLPIQNQKTTTGSQDRQNTGTEKAERSPLTSSPKTQQQRGTHHESSFASRSLKRKQKSSDEDNGKSKRLKHQKEENCKAIGAKVLLEKNPASGKGPFELRTDQDPVKGDRPQPSAQISGDPSLQHPNLESIFNSDPNVVESSFLGFASDDITETEQRLQQLSASSMYYTSKLQEAALNVCCIPSSELNLPEDDDSVNDSSGSEMQEVVVGMALRNLANFPSDGSDWEAKVGGFMSVRLDEAVQLKKRESVLSQVCLSEKENIKENSFQQILQSAGKLVSLDGGEQPDMTEQLELSPKSTPIMIRSVTSNDKSRPKDAENRALSADSKVLRPRRALNYGSSDVHVGRSKRQKARLLNQTSRPPSPNSVSDHLRAASSNSGLPPSPMRSQMLACSTPKRSKKTNHKYKLVFSPETPKEERELILEHYVHDVTEEEIDFPKFSSPRQSNVVVSPIKKFAKTTPRKTNCLSPYRLKAPPLLTDLPQCGSPRKSLFPRRRHSTSSVPGKVFHFLLNPPGSPRKRDPSPPLPSSPLKQSSAHPIHSLSNQPAESPHQITYIPTNELNKVSPVFCTSSKPNFSSHILHPGSKTRRSDRLRRPSLGQSSGGHTLSHRPAKTWSLCVSFDNDICCTDDVYEFDDSKDRKTRSSGDKSSRTEKADSHKKKLQAKSKSDCCKTDAQPSDPSEPEFIEKFGLPYSFFR